MTREEYEERKRRLDEQLRSGIELLEVAHRQQLRALDLIWSTTAEGDVALPRFRSEAGQPPQPPAAPTPPVRRPQLAAWQLYREIKEALPRVPEVFDRNHVCQALGYTPDRGSLYRTLQELASDGVIAVQGLGSGKTPTRYKRVQTDGSPAEG